MIRMVVMFSNEELLSFLKKEADGFDDPEEMRYFGMYNYWLEYLIELVSLDLSKKKMVKLVDKMNKLEG